jgi:hypothetical protein
VRFQGDRGFVVTFNYTDPLYTLDLSDPTNPRAIGELEVPGFSTYLHPIGDSLILGVGQSADENDMAAGLQISLFDVSVFDKPRRIHQWDAFATTNDTYSNSDAEYDHHAFRYLKDRKMLIIPVTVTSFNIVPCEELYADDNGEIVVFGGTNATDEDTSSDFNVTLVDEAVPSNTEDGNDDTSSTFAPSFVETGCYDTAGGFDGFRVFKVDATKGIVPHFSIEHATGDYEYGGCYSAYGFLTPRSLAFGSDMVTLKGHTIQRHNLTTKLEDATPINLDEDLGECADGYYIY